jgi:hypothetical protein
LESFDFDTTYYGFRLHGWNGSALVVAAHVNPQAARFLGYVSAGTLSAPSNTSAGVITGLAGHFGSDSAFGTGETLANLGGFFKTTYNSTSRPASDNTFGGMAISWNQGSGSAEVDFWNVYDNGGGFYFKQKTGASSHSDVFKIDGVGDWLSAGYGRVGTTASAPTNTTAGDFTATRAFFTTGASFGTQTVFPANYQALFLLAGTRSTIRIGDDTASGYGRIEMFGRFAGASGAGQWMFEFIDTSWYLYHLTSAAFIITSDTSGRIALGNVSPVANVRLTLAASTYNIKFGTAGGTYSATFYDLIPVVHPNGTAVYLRVWT